MQEEEQYIKQKVKERYGKIALNDCCCVSGECCNDTAIRSHPSAIQSTKLIGYYAKDIDSIPESSVLGVGCGAPTKFAEIREGETIVDLGSGAGIDAFLAANKVGKTGKVIGVDMTHEMLEKARKNANDNGYTNVKFVKGDIERRIPVEDNAADLVMSNCVINLNDKVAAFKEIYRILKNDGGRMVISDLVTDREGDKDSVMDILKAMIMNRPGKDQWQDLMTMITYLVLQLIQAILNLLLYLHLNGHLKHILLKMRNHWFIEEHRLLIILMIILNVVVMGSGMLYRMGFLNLKEHTFHFLHKSNNCRRILCCKQSWNILLY